ncbi:MAG: SLC13 family permease [Candidatus Sigynarchaeota archaeon]
MLITIISLVVFALVIILILKPLRIKLPGRVQPFQLDYGYAPLIGVAITLLTFEVPPSVLVSGILGTATIRPYMIIILFFSLAYVCISIDLTGFFEYLALSAAKKSGSSGKKLFLYFFLLSSVLTVFTSNDIVILTITPIILYFCKYTKKNPFPYLIGQFFAANIWSITLYIGNPTNIIVAQAYGLTFVQYSAWMILPTVTAGFACYGLLAVAFRKEICQPLSPPDIKPEDALKDRPGAVFSIAMLGTCLGFLMVAPIIGLDMGIICLIFAIIMIGKDIAFEARVRAGRAIATKDNPIVEPGSNRGLFHSVKVAAKRMPWKIMPFVFGMFIMVEILSYSGWVSFLASAFGEMLSSAGVIGSTFAMCFISALTCNIMNNQPMTILFTRLLKDTSFTSLAPAGIVIASLYALIMGSNFGANFTLIGALAGIMWSSITSTNGIKITYKEFAKQGFKIMPVVVALACTVLAIEVAILFA